MEICQEKELFTTAVGRYVLLYNHTLQT